MIIPHKRKAKTLQQAEQSLSAAITAGKGPYWSKRRGITLLIFCLGAALVGITALLLGLLAHGAFALFSVITAAHAWFPFISLPLGGILLTGLMHLAGPGTEGSGIQQDIAAIQLAASTNLVQRFINARLAITKFFALILGTLSGFVVGLEGPTVQLGASILYPFRRFFPMDTTLLRRQLLMAGGAAGIAAAFNAPLAGLMFAFEELGSSTRSHTPSRVAVAVILAGSIAYAFSAGHTYFGPIFLLYAPPLELVKLLPILFLVTIAGALSGGAFSWLALRAAVWMPKPVFALKKNHPYIFVVLCGLLIAACGLGAPIFGSGAALTADMLHGTETVQWYYAPLKFCVLLLTNLTSIPGGVFAPSLSLGAGIAGIFLPLTNPEWAPHIICAGMVAVLAAVTRAPLTAAFIIIEMTDGHSLVPEALAVAFFASYLARLFRVRFYHELALRNIKRISRQQGEQ